MIQEIKIKNYLSFKDEVVLSFEATKDSALEDNYVVEVAPGVRLLRFAMVMGANASGKSNLLLALDFMRQWWFFKPEDVEEPTGSMPFMLDSETMDQASELELRFWVDGTKYCYYLKCTEKQVVQERLQVYKSVQPTLVFNRELQNEVSVITINPAVEKVSDVVREQIQVNCLNNMSFFAARQQVNASLPEIDKVRDWMRNAIQPIIDPEIKMYEWAKEEMAEAKDVKKHIVQFLHSTDFNICDILRKEKTAKIPAKLMKLLLASDDLPKEERKRLEEDNTFKQVDVKFVHHVENERGDEIYTMDEGVQSYGTRRSIGMESAIYEATKGNSFLNIDEFDTSMHYDLVVYILKRFLEQDSTSQMLVTTHCIPLLGQIDELIRKDSVWFTERDKNGSSRLYTLVEFRGLNRMSSIQNAYLAGKFGARPKIQESSEPTVIIENNYGTIEVNE